MVRDRLSQVKAAPAPTHDVPLLEATFINQSYPMQTVPRGTIKDFMTQINSIRTHLHSFRSTISLLSELHALHLNASTDTLQAQLSAKIAAARSEATALANRVRMEITALNARNKQDGLGREAFEVRKVQLQSVHRTFQGVLVEFNSTERDARGRYRERAEKQYRIVKADATQGDIDAALGNSQQGSQIFGHALLQSRQSGARVAYADAQSRNAELRNIEETITELANMMNDLATLVFEQDQAFEDIERNAMETEKDTAAGLAHVSRAKRLAAAARKMRWWCLGFFLIIIIILIIALVLHFK